MSDLRRRTEVSIKRTPLKIRSPIIFKPRLLDGRHNMTDTIDANTALAALAESTKQVTTKTKKRRPARKQVEAKKLADQAPKQTGHTYNIWYSKWSGGDHNDPFAAKEHAETRCSIAKDSGYTRGDRTPGTYFCLFFARGMCPNGYASESSLRC